MTTRVDGRRSGAGDRPRRDASPYVTIAVTALVLSVMPLWIGDSRTLTRVAVSGLLFACYAIAFNLIFGSTNQLFLAVGALAGTGAYTSAITSGRLGVPLPFAIFLGMVVAMTISGLFSWIAVRRSLGIIFTGILTLTFSLAFDNLLLGLRSLTGGETGMVINVGKGAFFRGRIAPYYVFLSLLVVFLLVWIVIHRSRMGWAFRALRDDQLAAELSGIDVARYRIYAGVIGGAMLGLSGAVWAHVEGFISPATFTFVHVDVDILIMVVFGGIGTLLGPVIGAGFFTYFGEMLAPFSQLRLTVEGTLLIVLFFAFPQGVMGTLQSSVTKHRGSREKR